MSWIILVPGVLSALLAFSVSPLLAFASVYLPTLLLLPDGFRFVLNGLPDPNFCEAAILPIAAFWALKDLHRMRFSVTDALVPLFALVCGLSQFSSLGYAAAQNYMFDIVSRWLAPYFIARTYFDLRNRVTLLKRIVILLVCLLPFLVYDFRMKFNLYQALMSGWFPDQPFPWRIQFRWGWGRAAGPFGHSILCGLILMTGLFLHRFLSVTGEWRSSAASRLFTGSLLLGIIMTQSRGAWLATVIGMTVLWLAKPGNRKAKVRLVGIVVGVVLLPGYIAFKSYLQAPRLDEQGEALNSAAYRTALVDSYLRVAEEKPILGWGLNEWPAIPSMKSIDNNYLLLTLNHGFTATAMFLAIIFVSAFRLTRYGLATDDFKSKTLAFHLLAILVGFSFTLFTVYLGTQTTDVFFMLIGMSDRLVRPEAPILHQEARPAFAFRTVIK